MIDTSYFFSSGAGTTPLFFFLCDTLLYLLLLLLFFLLFDGGCSLFSFGVLVITADITIYCIGIMVAIHYYGGVVAKRGCGITTVLISVRGVVIIYIIGVTMKVGVIIDII